MKKLWISLFILLLFSFSMSVNAAVQISKHRTGYYYFDKDEVKREIILLENEKTHMPIFQLNYGADLKELWLEEQKTTQFSEEELKKIQEMIMILMDHNSYPEKSSWDLIGIQVLIWEIWKEKTNEPIRYSFGTNIKGLNQTYEEKLKTYWEPKEYEYYGYTNQKLVTSFLPMFENDYSIVPINSQEEIKKEENTITFKTKNSGDYRYVVESSYFDEKINYYVQNTMDFIEVEKPKEKKVYLTYHIENEPKTSHHILFLNDEGGTFLNEKNEFFFQDEVVLNPSFKEGYEMDFMDVKTINNEEVHLDQMKFLMPDSDIVVRLQTKKKKEEDHYLFLPNYDGITFSLPNKAEENSQISFQYYLAEGYQMWDLNLFTISGKKVPILKNSFIMPEEDVVFTYQIRKEELESEKEENREEEKNFELYTIPNTKVYSLLLMIILLFLIVSYFLLTEKKNRKLKKM